jgi:hypothetical protein
MEQGRRVAARATVDARLFAFPVARALAHTLVVLLVVAQLGAPNGQLACAAVALLSTLAIVEAVVGLLIRRPWAEEGALLIDAYRLGLEGAEPRGHARSAVTACLVREARADEAQLILHVARKWTWQLGGLSLDEARALREELAPAGDRHVLRLYRSSFLALHPRASAAAARLRWVALVAIAFLLALGPWGTEAIDGATVFALARWPLLLLAVVAELGLGSVVRLDAAKLRWRSFGAPRSVRLDEVTSVGRVPGGLEIGRGEGRSLRLTFDPPTADAEVDVGPNALATALEARIASQTR